MQAYLLFHYRWFRQRALDRWNQLQAWCHQNRWRLGGVALLFFMICCKDVEVSLQLQNSYSMPAVAARPTAQLTSSQGIDWSELLETVTPSEKSKKSASMAGQEKAEAPTPAPLDRRGLNANQRRQMAYVDRFARVARMEMEKFGIPASITLAQGLLESDAGQSILASKHNNHFGIKCFHRNCEPGHCFNYADDDPKDHFRSYGTAWESFRAHSRFLMRERYAKCRSYGDRDYKNWARGLAKAGYATDPAYAKKLISLIESLRLDYYDR